MTRWRRLAVVVVLVGIAGGCVDRSVDGAATTPTTPPASAFQVALPELPTHPAPSSVPTPATVPVEARPVGTGVTVPAPRPRPGPEGWVTLVPSPLSARTAAISVWTGEELLVWRGGGNYSDACLMQPGGEGLCGEPAHNDGAAFNPDAGTWRMIPGGPLPEITGSAVEARGVWTGAELVIWGLREGVGAAYDPLKNTWRSLPPAPLAPRRFFAMAWTGSEVVVVGGYPYAGTLPRDDVLVDGAGWDPVSGAWRRLPDLPAPRSSATLAALSDGLYLVGGWSTRHRTLDMVALVGEGTAWEPRAPSPGTGSRTYAVAGDTIVEVVPPGGLLSQAPPPASTSRYDPVADRWEPLAPIPIDRAWSGGAVWTGRELIIVGGAETHFQADPDPALGAALDLTTGRWRELPDGPLDDLAKRSGMALAWTGTEVLAWGGALASGLASQVVDGGVRYSPGR